MVPLRVGPPTLVTRVALLTEIPAPYRIPLFNALADRVDLRVFFLSERNPERPYGLHRDEWRFDAQVLRGRDWTVAKRWIVLNRGVTAALDRADAVLVGGWNQPAFWQATTLAKLRGRRAGAWIESTSRDTRSQLAAPVKSRLVRAFDVVIVPGRAALDHVRALGVDEAKTVIAPNAVDAELLASAARERTGESTCRVLYVGRLAREKGVDLLLDAARDLDVEVVIVGAGPEEPRLRARASGSTRFLGHVDRDHLPQLYADADVLVVPSRSEPWGMALNEGAAAGLPLVASDAAGAAFELIEDGVNGIRFPSEDVAALRAALKTLCGDAALRGQMGERSRALAKSFTPERWADAVAAALAR